MFALKESKDRRSRSMLQNEAEFLRILKHPCIVGFVGYRDDGSRKRMLLMEYCEWGSLASLIELQRAQGYLVTMKD